MWFEFAWHSVLFRVPDLVTFTRKEVDIYAGARVTNVSVLVSRKFFGGGGAQRRSLLHRSVCGLPLCCLGTALLLAVCARFFS